MYVNTKGIEPEALIQTQIEGEYTLAGRKLLPKFKTSFPVLVIKDIPKAKQRVSYCQSDLNFINPEGGAEYISGLFNTKQPNIFSLDHGGIKYLLQITKDDEGGGVATIKFNGLKRKRS